MAEIRAALGELSFRGLWVAAVSQISRTVDGKREITGEMWRKLAKWAKLGRGWPNFASVSLRQHPHASITWVGIIGRAEIGKLLGNMPKFDLSGRNKGGVAKLSCLQLPPASAVSASLWFR